jgi:hypothetical protein
MIERGVLIKNRWARSGEHALIRIGISNLVFSKIEFHHRRALLVR